MTCRRESILERSNTVRLRKSLMMSQHTSQVLDSSDILQIVPEMDQTTYGMNTVNIEVDTPAFTSFDVADKKDGRPASSRF